MKRLTLIGILLLWVVIMLLCACDRPTKPTAPKPVVRSVMVVENCPVEKTKAPPAATCPDPDIPAWLTNELPNDPPKSPTVEALREANDRRARLVDYSNCRSRALRKALAGQKVSESMCR